MRKIIAWEGEVKVPGQLLEIGSMRFPESGGVLVESSNADFSKPPLGKASDFRREDDGSVTAEIELFKLDPEDLAFTVYGNQVEGEMTGERGTTEFLWRITSFNLLCIYVDMFAPWSDVNGANPRNQI